VHKLELKIGDLKVEIERQREKIKEDKVPADKKDCMLESVQMEIADLCVQVKALQNQVSEQKKLITVYEDRFDTKGENILELNARVENADNIWAKIEEREKKLTLKECTSNFCVSLGIAVSAVFASS
jgi:flagellar biosynthesis chaperone FliJ